MNVSVVDVSDNQKKLHVEIPASKVQKEIEARYQDLAKRVNIKGFRRGKVPRSILKSYYGKSIEQEVSSQLIQETFPEALKESELKPLVEADVDQLEFDGSGAFKYVAIVDVAPPFTVEGYRGLKVKRTPVSVGDEQLQAELEKIQQQHSELRTVEEDRPIKEGDMVVIDFVPSIEGIVYDRGKTDDYMLEVGKKPLHPDFDEQLIGHRSGETLSFDLHYPEDADLPDLAGKTVHFEVTIKEIKEKVVPELNDEFAQTVGQFDTLDALREEIAKQLQAREEDRVGRETRQQIIDEMLKRTEFEVSPKVIEREVDQMIGMLLHQFESQGLRIDTSRFNTPEIRADYRPQAERNVRWRIIAQRIAEQEHLELTGEELEAIYKEVARYARLDVETLKRDYAETSIIEQSKENKILDKVMKLIEAEAVYEDSPQAEEDSSQE